MASFGIYRRDDDELVYLGIVRGDSEADALANAELLFPKGTLIAKPREGPRA